MTDDLVKRLRAIDKDIVVRRFDPEMSFDGMTAHKAADHIEDLKGQIKFIQGAAQNAQKAYEQHLAVYRKALDEKPPVWHDDIQSLQERDAIMTERVEKLEAALRKYADEEYNGFNADGAHARKALEGKDV